MNQQGTELINSSQAQMKEMKLAPESLFFNMAKFEAAKQVAKMFAASTMVPQHFRGADHMGDVMIALDLAERLRVNPFMLMQTIGMVHGRPAFEAKLLIAIVNSQGTYKNGLEYEFVGEDGPKEKMECRAYATEKATGITKYGPWITWEMVEAEGWNTDKPNKNGGGVTKSKWNTMPTIMFAYRAASYFVNRHCPELKLGLLTIDEAQEVIDLSRSGAVYGLTDKPETKSAPAGEDIYDAKTHPEAAQPPDPPPESESEEPPFTTETVTTPPEKVGMNDEAHIIDSFLRLRTTGLTAFEKEHHDEIQAWEGKLREAWIDKWLNVMKRHYFSEGQPGYVARPEESDPPPPESTEAPDDFSSLRNNLGRMDRDALKRYEKQYRLEIPGWPSEEIRFFVNLWRDKVGGPYVPGRDPEELKKNGSDAKPNLFTGSTGNGRETIFCDIKGSRTYPEACEKSCDPKHKDKCRSYHSYKFDQTAVLALTNLPGNAEEIKKAFDGYVEKRAAQKSLSIRDYKASVMMYEAWEEFYRNFIGTIE